jgi:hypothetical protein
MKSTISQVIVLLTTLLLSACATTIPHKVALKAADPCEPRKPATHCISGEELTRFGAANTADALRHAFPWFY